MVWRSTLAPAAVAAWTADSDWQWGDVEEPVIRPKGQAGLRGANWPRPFYPLSLIVYPFFCNRFATGLEPPM
ncbi:MAG TPA: hypothetical protein VD886_12100 [Herpetosiphonaceae bacterium]|nr:hypothetical protein [Herpetosiphonaceae bacterium]